MAICAKLHQTTNQKDNETKKKIISKKRKEKKKKLVSILFECNITYTLSAVNNNICVVLSCVVNHHYGIFFCSKYIFFLSLSLFRIKQWVALGECKWQRSGKLLFIAKYRKQVLTHFICLFDWLKWLKQHHDSKSNLSIFLFSFFYLQNKMSNEWLDWAISNFG